ncbi:MAG: Gfo/Idh/MocA family oxidoreductase [Planctomycetota bacterium]
MTTDPTAAANDSIPFRLGAVGVDSSHLPEFTRRINERFDAGLTRCRVTAFWADGQHDMPADQVATWVADTEALGARPHDQLDTMLDAVDGVMVLTVNGHKHLAHATPALERGLPTYVDKPLTCDPAEAKTLLALSEKYGARCYSASSLRFAAEVHGAKAADLGALAAIDAYGPGELHELMAGTFFYGVHTIEMVDALWGPGVAEVSARQTEDRDLLQMRYHDGRTACLRLERRGAYDFGATVHGSKAIQSFKVDFATVYDRLIDAMIRFFAEGEAPVSLVDIVENVAVMAAANRSFTLDGAWVKVDA